MKTVPQIEHMIESLTKEISRLHAQIEEAIEVHAYAVAHLKLKEVHGLHAQKQILFEVLEY